MRAIAVLAVVFYHAGLGIGGGYVGVDVFFVISGFLITGLILKELSEGTFSILNFWERRIRRILPALTVVTCATLVVGWFLLLPSDFQGLARSVIALVAFSSNIQFWRESNYFAADSELKPILHTWSLSVEEQFYLLIPMLLFLMRKKHRVTPAIVTVVIVSFILACLGMHWRPIATFFLLPTRAWELGTGSLLAACCVALSRQPSNRMVRVVMGWTGLSAVLIPCFLYKPDTAFPGIAALPPVVGTALIIWSGLINANGEYLPLPNRILASRPLVWVGLLSYSLYLWHWPLFAYYRYLFSSSPGIGISLILVLIAFIASWFSLHFVERPVRSRSLIPSRNVIFLLAGGMMLLMLLPASIIWRTGGAPHRISAQVASLDSAANDASPEFELSASDVPEKLGRLGSANATRKVLVWGDSHAMALLPAVDSACKQLNMSVLVATHSSTAPVLDWFKHERYGLNESAPAFNQAVIDFVRNSASSRQISTIILAAKWESYVSNPATRAGFESALVKTIGDLEAAGCRVVLVRDVPEFHKDVPRSLALYALLHWQVLMPHLTDNDYERQTEIQDQIFVNLQRQYPSLQILNPEKVFVNADRDIPPINKENIPLWRDTHHLSTHGSLCLAGLFSKILLEHTK